MSADEPTTQPIAPGRHCLEFAPSCPPAVLVTEQERGGFILQGYPTGPAVYVTAGDSGMLRHALDAAFEVVGTELNLPPIIRPRI